MKNSELLTYILTKWGTNCMSLIDVQHMQTLFCIQNGDVNLNSQPVRETVHIIKLSWLVNMFK